MKKNLLFCVLIILLNFPAMALAGLPEQRATLKGHIRDARDGEDLIGASIYVQELRTGTTTNVYGFYSLSLPTGEYTLSVTFVGYQTLSKSITLLENTVLNLELEPESRYLEEVVVTGERPDQNVAGVRMSTNNLRMETVRSLPAFMGEVDVIKSLVLLPGVSAGGEGSTGLFVRGGGVDQNLILLDEATVYNASHLMGFFSVFNPDAIKDVQVYKGGIPAHYGGRLSSVIDIRMKDGNSRRFSGTGGIGSISSRLTLEGPIQRDVSSFVLSGRRTYADLFLPLAPDTNVRNSRLYFYDLNAKANYRFGERDRLFFSSYSGRDILRVADEFHLGWGNTTATLRWNHIFNSKIFSNFTLLYSNFDYMMGLRNDVNSFDWTSHIEDIALKADFTWYPAPEHTVRFGMQSMKHGFNLGLIRGVGEGTAVNDYGLPMSHALEHAIYLSNEHNVSEALALEYGMRYSLFQNIGPGTVYQINEQYQVTDTLTYARGEIFHYAHGLEPRLGLRYSLGNTQSVKASYNRTRQYMQQTNTASAGSPLDIWFPGSPNVKPQVADQWALGYFRNFRNNMFEVSLEGYYKDMRNQLDFRDHAEILLNPQLEADLRSGKAWSYGLEFMLNKTRGDFTGWLSYTWSRAWQQIEGINNGNRYPAFFDRPHDISLVLAYDLSERINIAANWVYHTGRPVTLPVGRYEYGGVIVPVYSDRNASRIPDYHRLDLSLTLDSRIRPGRNWQGSWNFSVYNAYFRKNVWAYTFRPTEQNSRETQAYMTYLFGIVPSVTYNFKF
jgi:hypothetical protein